MDGSRTPAEAWTEANQRYLVAALSLLRCHLERRSGDAVHEAQRALTEAESAMPAPPAIAAVAEAFRLSPFERDLLLLCAGVELDASFAACCAEAQGDPRSRQPTFGLALAALPGAHWSALGPAAPLRRFHLVEVGAGEALTRSPLRIDERVLHHLVGVEQPSERLAGVLEPLEPPADLVPSHRKVAERIASALQRAAHAGPLPIVALCGDDPSAKADVAAAACAALGVRLDRLAASAIGGGLDEVTLARLLAREAILAGGALLLDGEEIDEQRDPARWAALRRLIERTPGLVFVAARGRLWPARRPAITFEIRRPSAGEQRGVWREALAAQGAAGAPDALDALADPLAAHFDLGAPAIRAACAVAAAALGEAPGTPLSITLWDACRSEARPALDGLASRIEAQAPWDALVLPAPEREVLRGIATHVRRRAQVYEAWGFARGGARGLGVSALFAGASGTGKTLAAEVLAGDLRLDLYRVDLGQVVSKYIGETEKNLGRVFDAAEQGAAILLFDEADALFGRRTEVKDSHDRYANLEIAYLLQRMEAYRGLSILTTNLKDAIDPAFARRIRFVVEFPFPSAAKRAEIWRRVFPAETPLDAVDFERLARLNIAGGSIRNIAMGAAFLAADAGEPVRMAHLVEAARAEYAKLGRALPEGEITG